tara:strand:- start:656 stop:1285 length:630 start_codon:yes stop_codon:yes gene_type:complete
MWALVKADQVIEVFGSAKAMTINGVQHPASIFNNWTKEELKTLGIYPVTQASPADNRFYRNGASSYSYSDEVVTETISSTPYEMADVTVTDKDDVVLKNTDGTTMITKGLITKYKEDIDNHAYNALQSSDWMAVRQYEAGVSITDDWKTYRAGVRTKAAEMKTAVSAVTSVGALKDLHVVYVPVTATDGTVTTTIGSGILYNFGEAPTT